MSFSYYDEYSLFLFHFRKLQVMSLTWIHYSPGWTCEAKIKFLKLNFCTEKARFFLCSVYHPLFENFFLFR